MKNIKKFQKQRKDKKTGEKKSRKKRKRGPKGVKPPEMGPKNDFSHENCQEKFVTKLRFKKNSDFEHPTKTKKMKENERKMKET